MVLNKKILVATPTYEGHEEFLQGYIESISNQSLNCDILFANTSSDPNFHERLKKLSSDVILIKNYETKEDKVINARREIIRYFLEGDWDYLLFVDTDVFITPETAEHLSSHNLDIVAGICLSPQRIENKNYIIPIAYDFGPDENHRRPLTTHEVLSGKHLLKLHSVGFGCCMLSRKICEKVKIRDFQGGHSSEDIFFCIDARKAGFDIFYDTFVFANHHGWKLNDPKNNYLRKEYYIAHNRD